MFFIELAGAVIILSVLTCLFKDFVLKCLKLWKIINNFKKLDEINKDAYRNSVTENQTFLILLSTAVIGILILITSSPFIINIPVYVVTLLICWYIPLKSELESQSIFKNYIQNVKFCYDDKEFVAYLSVSDNRANPQAEYWGSYLENTYNYKRYVTAICICEEADIKKIFPNTFKSLGTYQMGMNYRTLCLKYNVLNKHEITKYLDI